MPRSPAHPDGVAGLLGPSTTWLVRRLADSLDANPPGFELPVEATARLLGLGGKGGRLSPFLRSVNRLLMFDIAASAGTNKLAVRRRMPWLNHRQLARLDADRLALHEVWPRPR